MMGLLIQVLAQLATAFTVATATGPGPIAIPISQEDGFLFTQFDVGESKNLSLILGTLLAPMFLNSGIYNPTTSAKKIDGFNGSLYGTLPFGDTCFRPDSNYSVYSDAISVHGVRVADQRFASDLKASTPALQKQVVEYPHDGILGLAGGTSEKTSFEGLPFLQSLCNQSRIDECRFGLALGPDANASLILGGVANELMEGEVASATLIEPGYWWAVNGNVTVNGETSTSFGGEIDLTDQSFSIDSSMANVSLSAAVRACDGN